MDATIRQLLSVAASSDEEQGTKNVIEAYNLLQEAFGQTSDTDAIDVCGSDLYILCAELCFKLQQFKVAQECLRMYFNGRPLTNQFLCRAYLCQAQLMAPKSADDVTAFETAVVYLLKAINFSRTKPRYHFVVFNASVLYWQMARPFLRPKYCGMLSQSLQQVVKALDEIDDCDYEWRATLMIALIESFVDAGSMKDAASSSQSAAQFTLTKAKSKFKNVFQLQIKHKLVDLNKLAREVKNMPEYAAFFKLQKIKSYLSEKPSADVRKDLIKLVATLTGKSLPSSKPSTSESTKRRSLHDELLIVQAEESRIRTSSAASKRKLHSATPAVHFAEVVSISVHIQHELDKMLRPYLLLEVARLCVDMNLVLEGVECLEALDDVDDPSLTIEAEFLQCELMVKELGDEQNTYTRHSVETRNAAIKKMEQALENAVRSSNANIVQGACATQWNLCLPLLQTNLRKLVRRPLTAVAEALESISSMQVKLRCQVHMELAKCEEAVEQVEAAVKHVNKALQLDDSGFYQERLQTMLHRLQLSTQLYRTPDRPEDIAANIIEQARKSAESGSAHMKRSLLVKAGLALAPDAFQYVLDSENEMKAFSGVKGLTTEVQKLGARAQQWQNCIKKAPGHLKRLGDENDRERARLWVDLAKAARQQQVWDVCRVASTFCLLYDDGRWKMGPREPSRSEKSKSGSQTGKAPGTGDTASIGQKSPVPRESVTDSGVHDADLLRMLAEVQFVKGEAFIHLLRCEGLKLNESPTAPVDTRQRPKGHEYKRPEEEPEWAVYTDWIHDLNRHATNSFLRAVELGIELDESWIICNAAAYVWNYNNHLLSAERYSELVPTLEKVLFGMKEIGHSSESTLLVRICDVIAKGLVAPWIPKPVKIEGAPTAQTAPPVTTKDTARKKGGKTAAGNAATGTTASLSVKPEGMDDLKKALEVCEYGLIVTNGSTPGNCIPTTIRHQLLSTWVKTKQLMQQQIAPNFGVENEKLPHQRDMTKVLVILEMLALNRNDLMEFTVPELAEVCDLVDGCNWDDPCVELEVWSRLAQLARIQKNHAIVNRCANNGLRLESSAVKKKARAINPAEQHKQMVALEMLSCASCILGESLMDTCAANPPARRQAMQSFVEGGKFAERAKNFTLVMTSCRRWWNAALPLIPSPLERELLRQPLEILLQSILSTASTVQTSDESEEMVSKKREVKMVESEEGKCSGSSSVIIGDSLTDPADDRTLRAAMYGVLFQTYADKDEWEQGLVVMDRALHNMPRTKHRMLLFKHRIIVKAKLGKDVHMDIAKFRDESESYVSHMWHRVALCSCDTLEQLMAFQRSIEALHTDETSWQKFEYLLELSSWMHSNEFPNEDSINTIEWACDILLKIKFEIDEPDEIQIVRSKGKNRKISKPASRQVVSRVESKQAQKPVEDEEKKKKDKDEKEKKVETHVPVEREVIIGVEPSQKPVQLNDLKSTRQLEGLIRGHVMMATISGQGSKEHVTFCLLAYGFVMRLWKSAMASASVVVKTLPKIEPEDVRRASGKSKKTPPVNSTAKPKMKRKGPLDAIPASTSDWATFDPPDEIKQAFAADPGDCAISKQTITCAGMTVFHLLKLSDYLRDCGLNHLAFPVLSLAGVITHGILQSPSWTQLINIKQITVCYELHLLSAAEQWEAAIGNLFLPESEQVSSRQEVQLKEIQRELAKLEEERIRKARGEKITESDKKSSAKTGGSHESKTIGPVTLLGRKVGGVNLGEIWTEKAKLLITLGHYQVSRTLLNEALSVATYNNDNALKADIYHGLALLAVREGNNGQALLHVKNAQTIGGDENFWLENITLLVDATLLNQDPSPEDVVKVMQIIRRATGCINILADIRPSKSSTIGFMKATLNARSSLLRLRRQTKEVVSLLKKLDHAEQCLQDLGYHRQLAKIHLEHCDVLLRLSIICRGPPHTHLLLAIRILEKSVDNLTVMCSDAVSLETDKSTSFPVQRELLDVQLRLACFYLEAFERSSEDEREAQAQEATKDPLRRMVEEYVGESDACVDSTEWNLEKSTFVHKAFGMLNLMHSSLPAQHESRCTWLYLYGRGLRLLAEKIHPDHPGYQWAVSAYEIDDLLRETEAKDTEVTPRDDEEPEPLSKQQQKMAKEAEKLRKQAKFSNRLLANATEILAQCLAMSLQVQSVDVASKASLEMVECCAQCDPQTAAAHLALHQSAVASMNMRDLVMKSLSDPTVSQLSSLLHQMSWLSKNSVSTGLDQSSMFKSIVTMLSEKFTGWRRLQLSPNHLDLLKDFPPSYNIVILQPAPDNASLYCAILDKPKAAPATNDKPKAKDKQAAPAEESRCSLVKIPVDRAKYLRFMDIYSDYKQRLMSFLLQSEYQRSQLAMRQNMLQELSKAVGEMVVSQTSLEDQAIEEMKLRELFDKVLSEMETYLSSVSAELQSKLIRLIEERAEQHLQSGQPLSELPPEVFVLLTGANLLELPLEALECLQTPHIDAVSRDFSLQMLHKRWYVDPDEAAAAAERKKNEGKNAPKSAKGAKKTATPGARVVPLNRELPPGCASIDTHGVRYVVDPRNDCSETEQYRPDQTFKQMMQLYSATFTPRWNGVFGTQNLPTIGQWEQLLNECSVFIFYGMERFIAQFPPSKLISLNLEHCQMALLLDKSQTNKSFRHQSKIDVDKTSRLFSIEKPVETAMLLSLSGSNCVCLNQWHTTLEGNASNLQSFMTSILEEGLMVGQATKKITNPTLVKPSPRVVEPEHAPVGKDGKGKDGRRNTSRGLPAVASPATTPRSLADDYVSETATPQPECQKKVEASWCNLVLFGLPNLVVS